MCNTGHAVKCEEHLRYNGYRVRCRRARLRATMLALVNNCTWQCDCACKNYLPPDVEIGSVAAVPRTELVPTSVPDPAATGPRSPRRPPPPPGAATTVSSSAPLCSLSPGGRLRLLPCSLSHPVVGTLFLPFICFLLALLVLFVPVHHFVAVRSLPSVMPWPLLKVAPSHWT